MRLSPSPRTERSRSGLRWVWWQAILSGPLQFLRELHFIEAGWGYILKPASAPLQFLRELHFIEASISGQLRIGILVAVPSGTALH